MADIRLAFLASLGYAKMPPQQVVQSLSAIGYQGVEWTPAHFDPRTHTQAELEQLVEITLDAGLAISEVVVQQDLICLDERVRQDRIGHTLECIDAAGKTGVKTLNLFTGPAPWDPTAPVVGRDIPMGAAWGQMLEAFDRFVSAAAQADVGLAVEGVFGHLCHDYFSTRALIDHYRQNCLGVNFDPSHDVLYGNTDTGWLVRQWGAVIKHVHLKDAVGIPVMGQFLFPLLGEGRVDWPGLFAALDEIDYRGFCSVEFESFDYLSRVLGDDIEAAARLSFDQVQALRRLT